MDSREATVANAASKPFTRLIETASSEARAKAFADLPPRYGLSRAALLDPDGRIPYELSLELLERSAWLLGSDAIALRAVQGWQLGDQGIGDYLNATCDTAGDLLATITNHVPLLNDGIHFTFETDGETARLYYDVYPGVTPSRWVTETALGKVVAHLRRALGPERACGLVRLARFRHSAPEYHRDYREVFGAPVQFGDDRDVLEFRTTVLTERLNTADPVLHALLHRQAESVLRARLEPASLLDRVRCAVRTALHQGSAAQPSVARRVGVSVATLRRRLESDHGVRYSDLVDELRRERIEAQLADPDIPIDKVSFEAGFSQTSAFYRTFKRWYGCTPTEYRRVRSR